MTGLGERDRPGTPDNPGSGSGPRDARSPEGRGAVGPAPDGEPAAAPRGEAAAGEPTAGASARETARSGEQGRAARGVRGRASGNARGRAVGKRGRASGERRGCEGESAPRRERDGAGASLAGSTRERSAEQARMREPERTRGRARANTRERVAEERGRVSVGERGSEGVRTGAQAASRAAREAAADRTGTTAPETTGTTTSETTERAGDDTRGRQAAAGREGVHAGALAGAPAPGAADPAPRAHADSAPRTPAASPVTAADEHPSRGSAAAATASAAGPRTPSGSSAASGARSSAGTVASGGPAHRPAVADPVKILMHRHRELCERAVDPLEIAAGLEAHGITDRTATRFRHRDVFSLAEEMYARVPRGTDPATRTGAAPETTAPEERADAPDPAERPDRRRLSHTLLPGAVCAAAVAALHLTEGRARLTAAACGVLALALALRGALRRGPLATSYPTAGRGRTRVCWLLGYALLGDGLLRAAVSGGPDALPTGGPGGEWPTTTAPVLALALSCAPAAWCAHLFATRAHRKLALSRVLEDFSAAVLPLLLGVFALYLGALTLLIGLCGTLLDEPAPYAATTALGGLLFLARLLTVHGFPHAPALVLTAVTVAEATVLAAVFASRVPGCDLLGTPARAVVEVWGPSGLPALACAAGAAVLLLHASRRLTRASAHALRDHPW